MKADEAVNEVLKISKMFLDDGFKSLDGNELTELSVRLAAYKVYLGEAESISREQAEKSEFHLETVKDQVFTEARKSGSSVADAETLKRTRTERHRLQAITSRQQYRRISNLYNDCKYLLEAIRSLVIHLQQEKAESK